MKIKEIFYFILKVKYFQHFIKLFFFLISPILYFLLKITKIFKIIRITPVKTDRYGHLSTNLENYLVEKKEGKIDKKFFDIFITSRWGVCNAELLNLYKKNVIFFSHNILEPLLFFLNKVENNTDHTIHHFDLKHRDYYNDFAKYDPSIRLSEEQNRTCELILKKNGIDISSKKIVCLFNRDDFYLSNVNKKYSNKKRWEYLSHHRYNVNKFNKASEFLASKNIYLLRMGKGAEKDFGIKENKMFIDYANSSYRSDLMDIFLASKCLFGMGGGTGSYGVALVFRKPFLHLIANIHDTLTYKDNALLLSKHYFSKKLKRNLTLAEILNYSYGSLSHQNQIKDENIEIKECSEDEILNATKEMYERVEGLWTDSLENQNLQKIFKNHNWQNLTYKHNGKLVHPKINANYSSNFLINNKSWLGIKN